MWKTENVDWDKFKVNIDNVFDEHWHEASNDINVLWDIWKAKVNYAADMVMKKVPFVKNYRNFWDKPLDRMLKSRRDANRLQRLHNRTRNHDSQLGTHISGVYKKRKLALHEAIKRKEFDRKVKCLTVKGIATNKNSKFFWKLLRGPKESVNPSRIIDPNNKDDFIEDDADISECLKTHFSKIGKDTTTKPDFKNHVTNLLSEIESNRGRGENLLSVTFSNKDFTSNALYHSGCITKYLLREKEIKAETDENNTGTMYDKAFTSFVESISEELFVHKMVFSLSYLLSKYKSFLPEDVSSKYTSYRLQLRLKNHFREHIVVDVNHGQGESNFVYSSSLTLREAVRTAIRFKAETKFTKLQMSACTSKNDQTDENQILYSAASILRREIKNAVVPMDTYPSVDEMSLSKSLETVPSVLTGFINWLIDDSHSQGENKCLVLAGAFSNPEIVRQLSNEHVIDLPDLFCSHEEADTRILLHVIHSDKIFQQLNIRGRIIVKCSDTDVLVLCVHYFKVLVSTEQMWFLTGSTNSLRDCRRYIPIHELSKSLSPLLANILPAVHALTGCDTTSAIFGFGKKTVFKLIRKSPSKFTNLQNFDKIDFSTLLSAARELISSLYDPKDKFASSHVDLNKLRVKLATCKDTKDLDLEDQINDDDEDANDTID
ncbi:unnamed protein product [Mytilus edulis]|uniref:Uncharacterized protein n=1 Tax=Mytilus edulis TaxID=6550 RepID=A0A8S3S3V1_MYTED|nr:unnamed protein product [Mytilus edulis]